MRITRLDWALFAALLFVILICAVVVRCQELPDAPSATRTQPRKTPWVYGQSLTLGQTLRSPWFWGAVAAGEASYWADVGYSLAAIHRGCVEGNLDLPARPALGDYAVNWAKTELLLDGFQFILVKLNHKPTNWMAVAMSGARVGVHMHGVAAAWGCR